MDAELQRGKTDDAVAGLLIRRLLIAGTILAVILGAKRSNR